MAANVFGTPSQNSRQLSEGLATFGVVLAWQQWLAGMLDAMENVALVMMLNGHVSWFWPAAAWHCALPKFGFVYAGLAYTAAASITWLVRHIVHTVRGTL
jgi:hypothetical protein